MTAQSPHRLNPAPLTAITGIIAKCSCPVTALLRVLQRLLTEGLPISDQPRRLCPARSVPAFPAFRLSCRATLLSAF